MAGKRARIAGLLDRMGVLHAMLQARSRSLWPWRYLMVLTFHRVARPDAPGFDPDVADTTPEAFDRQLAVLSRYFEFIDTADLEAHRLGGSLPDNPVMITFDDGYRDNRYEALPILQRHRAKAVFFVATSYVSERRLFWWERINYVIAQAAPRQVTLSYPEAIDLDLRDPAGRREAIARLLRLVKDRHGLDLEVFLADLDRAAGVNLDRGRERELADSLVMNWDEVRALKAGGMDVQSHTHRHRILRTLTPKEVTADLVTSRNELETQLQAPVRAVAYPAGKSVVKDLALRNAIREAGFNVGMTSGRGAARIGSNHDWLDVPRLSMNRDMPDTFFKGLLAIPALSY
jgi:peptidoglycan/xylan/chitin deacetylase (PgdA/CDA1 family)